jgi:hypothetical protein
MRSYHGSPVDGLDPHRLNVFTQVWHVVFTIGVNALLG